MEITYRRTVQVREYESITIEAKTTSEDFFEGIWRIEEAVDAEIIEHRECLRNQYKQEEFADDEDLS